MKRLKRHYHHHHYRYKNLTLLGCSAIAAVLLAKNESIHQFLLHLGGAGYLGALFAGMLFVSTFTVAIGAVILVRLVEVLSPIELAVLAGLGGVIGDLVIFQCVRTKGLVQELKHMFAYLGGSSISHLFHTRYFSWTLPVVGAIIIASPLPDELGVSLMGISKMKTARFMLLSYALNTVGIFTVISMPLLFR